MKYPTSIEAIRYPVILGSFCEEGYNQFVHKLFVFCELLVYSFAVKSDAIVDGFLLFVLYEGRSLTGPDQHYAVIVMELSPKTLFQC